MYTYKSYPYIFSLQEYINMEEYKYQLYDTVESSSGTSTGPLNELLI